MELKLYKMRDVVGSLVLLIVPYGIETQKCDEYLPSHSLLIVPYGIETTLTHGIKVYLQTF